jgi:diguanylate cyclase (GGDEF)-like protein
MKPTFFSLDPQRLHGPVQAVARALQARLPDWAMPRTAEPAVAVPSADEKQSIRPTGERRVVIRPTALALPALVLKTHRDALTGLPTRACLDEASDELLLPFSAPGIEACLLCLEATGLALLAERYGSAVSDAVHQQLATRLRRLVRRSDTLIRLEGGRYLMLMSAPAGNGAALARTMATRAMADVQRPLSYRTLSTLRVDCCAGAAIGPIADRATLNMQLALADEALQSALSVGHGQFRQHVAA